MKLLNNKYSIPTDKTEFRELVALVRDNLLFAQQQQAEDREKLLRLLNFRAHDDALGAQDQHRRILDLLALDNLKKLENQYDKRERNILEIQRDERVLGVVSQILWPKFSLLEFIKRLFLRAPLRTAGNADKQKILLPPGTTLLKVFKPIMSKNHYERVLIPVVEDWQGEYFEALDQNASRWTMAFIRIRNLFYFLSELGLVGLGRLLLKLVKAFSAS